MSFPTPIIIGLRGSATSGGHALPNPTHRAMASQGDRGCVNKSDKTRRIRYVSLVMQISVCFPYKLYQLICNPGGRIQATESCRTRCGMETTSVTSVGQNKRLRTLYLPVFMVRLIHPPLPRLQPPLAQPTCVRFGATHEHES